MMNLNKKQKLIFAFFIVVFLLLLVGEIYVPKSFGKSTGIVYEVKKGVGSREIANDLERQGIVRQSFFFRLYAVISGNNLKLQAGKYDLSSSMSVAQIVKKITAGDIVKESITVVEGWDLQDIANLLESKKIMTKAEFLTAVKNYPQDFEFLKDRPAKLNLEGYLFPDTYEISVSKTPDDLVGDMLTNFDKKLTPDLRAEITRQKKSIFKIITMASIIEKEVRSLEDKKIVSGILWKRIVEGMPLQVDATVNYITGNNHPGVAIKDTKIDSPYNTYKYYGLPLGPICNPGMESILASIYPNKSDYWFYLSSEKDGKTIFSKTLDEHNIAVQKYLK